MLSRWGALALWGSAACGGPATGVAPAKVTHTIPAPSPPDSRVEPAGLTHVMRGLYFLSLGKSGAAIPHLRLGLIYAPESPFLHGKLARAWLDNDQPEKARRVLESGLGYAPEDPQLNLIAGEMAARQGRHQVAVEHFSLSAINGDTVAEVGPRLVESLMWLGMGEQALGWATRILDARPQDAELAVSVGEALEDHGQLEAGLEAYRRAREQKPAHRLAALSEMRVLELMGDLTAAADSLVSLFAFYPDAPNLYVQITRLLMRANHPDASAYRIEALRQTEGDPSGRSVVAAGDILEGRTEAGLALLRELEAAYPTDRDVRAYLIEVLAQMREVEQCLEVARQLTPESGAHRARAWCHGSTGSSDEMFAALERLIEASGRGRDAVLDASQLIRPDLNEEEARALFDRLVQMASGELSERELTLAEARIDDTFGHIDAARERVEQLLEKSPGDADLEIRLADLLARSEDLDRSLDILTRLVRQKPYDVIRLNALGFTLADADVRLPEAEVWLRRAYRLAPDDGFVIDSLGWLFYRQGNHEAALRLLERANRSSPDDPEILRHLGDVYRRLGREEDAKRAYEGALATRPGVVLRALINDRLQPPEGA